MMTTAISFENVSMSFDDFMVHRDLTFAIQQGEVVTILGPSGAGKTVILKLCIGLLRPCGGEIRFNGARINDLSEVEFSDIRKEIGMLFQGAALFDSLSVRENIAYSLRERGERDENKISNIVQEKLSIVGLPDIESKYPPQLSGGQKKRVGLARALASSPRVVLFDEPTTGLDPTAIRLIDELILKLKNDFSITSIVVTHDIESARRVSDRWLLLNDGSIVADGPVGDLSVNDPYVRDFINGNWRDD